MYIYIYIYRERERARERDIDNEVLGAGKEARARGPPSETLGGSTFSTSHRRGMLKGAPRKDYF